jgi:hypothetical protein
MTTSVKTCFKCGVEKPITGFYAHPYMKDGRLNKCKECTKRDVRKNYRDNIEHFREYERQRFKDPERKKFIRRYALKRKEKYPEKHHARNAVNNAVRGGRLERPDTCENCGNTGRIEAHHTDYSKPLDVKWLCVICHRAEHGQEAVWSPPAKEA